MGTPSDQTAFRNVAAVLACIPADAAQRNLLHEFKRALRPGGLLLISDYPLQSDQTNLDRYQAFAAELGTYGAFRMWATNAA